MPVLDYAGYCPICEKKVRFVAEESWYRDYLICPSCRSLPRNRALFYVLNREFPNFRELKIHESSPLDYIARAMFRNSPGYSASHFWSDIPLGTERWGYTCQDLENLTFPDESFDLFITMDVMEHILDPIKAFQEIARVLRPGGAHIFTVPLYNRGATITRAIRKGSNVKLLMPPQYHGNPLGGGSLVTREWNRESWHPRFIENIVDFIQKATGMNTVILDIKDVNLGILGEFTDVIISREYVSESANLGAKMGEDFEQHL